MQKISPFLWFDTQARDAARFYVSVFKHGPKITAGRAMAAMMKMQEIDVQALKDAVAGN